MIVDPAPDGALMPAHEPRNGPQANQPFSVGIGGWEWHNGIILPHIPNCIGTVFWVTTQLNRQPTSKVMVVIRADMIGATPILILSGTLRLSASDARRTAGGFSKLINDNDAVFRRYFGVALFPGSLNVDVPNPDTLQRDLDSGQPPPSFVIPRTELVNMPDYIGDGQAWPSILRGKKFPSPVSCWIFRRIGSRVPCGVIELVAHDRLRDAYALQHADPVTIEMFSRDGP